MCAVAGNTQLELIYLRDVKTHRIIVVESSVIKLDVSKALQTMETVLTLVWQFRRNTKV